jgi:ParB/RepB/Spo0J family partition protein
MNTEQIQQIPLEQIQPCDGNRKYGGFDPVKLQELADSIKTAGVLQPVLVRQNGEIYGRSPLYELVAGERRWRAARLAGLEVLPCVVRELDDTEVLKIQLIENLQREDIHPLDEADGYARLIERAGYDVEHLAQEVDRSPSYVYQRLKLRDLIEEARKLLIDGTIQAGHAILLARLQPAQQKELIGWLKARMRRSFESEMVSVRELDDYIHRTILLELSRAAFRKDDPDLLPEAGPCTTCPKRTGYQPALFADVCKKDYCTDPVCFNGKAEALVRRRRTELKEGGEKHLEVADEYVPYQEEQRLIKAGVKGQHAWEECKKGEEGAVRCLVVAGKSPGRLTWGRERKQNRYGSYQPTAADKAARQKQLLEAKIKAATRRRIWDTVLGVLDVKKVYNKPRIELLRMIAAGYWKRTMNTTQAAYGKAIGWELLPRQSGDWSDPWERTGMQQLAKMDSQGLVRFLLTLTLAPDLEGPGWQEKECRRLKEVADIYDLDVKSLEEEVQQQFKEKAKAREERAKKAAKTKSKKPRAKKAEASKK